MRSQSFRHERVLSDKAQGAPVGTPPRPGMGSRTSSAPAGDLHKIGLARRPSAAARIGQALAEEDEGSAGTSFAARRPLARHHTNEVRLSNRSSDFSWCNAPNKDLQLLIEVLFLQEPPKHGLPEVTIAVVGEDNAGKSSFIQCALDMKSAPSSFLTKKKMSLDGSIYMVRLLEIDLQQVTIAPDGQIMWPRMGRDDSATVVDGALLLHDSTQPDKLAETSELTGMFEARDAPLPSAVLPHLSAHSHHWHNSCSQTG